MVEDGQNQGHLMGRYLEGQGPPAISFTEQENEVRPRRLPLTPGDLLQTDCHRLLVERGLLADPPTEIYRLEVNAALSAELFQSGEHVVVQSVSFRTHIGECR